MSFEDHRCTVVADFLAAGKWATCSCGWSGGEIVTHEHLALADFAAHVHVAAECSTCGGDGLVVVEDIRMPEDRCVHCDRPIYLQGMWRHLASLLSACDNGRTNAQPPQGTRWGGGVAHG